MILRRRGFESKTTSSLDFACIFKFVCVASRVRAPVHVLVFSMFYVPVLHLKRYWLKRPPGTDLCTPIGYSASFRGLFCKAAISPALLASSVNTPITNSSRTPGLCFCHWWWWWWWRRRCCPVAVLLLLVCEEGVWV